MRVKLWVKLTGAFVLVAIVAVGLIAVLANRAASLGFQRYLQAGEMAQLELLQTQLAAYYAQTGSWAGANSLLRDSGLGGQGYFLRLLDADGAGVASRGGQGRFFEPEVSLPIRVDGRLVGTLMMARPGLGTHAGDQYLETVNRAIVWAGLAAAALALLLGALLAQGLTRPLRQMTQATRAVAAGDLAQQVRVDSRDELGELARDFNQMARALQTAEAQRQQLLADTAHDLRTPISVIRSHLEAMLDGVFPATPDNLALVHEETLRLGRLVEDVRTLSLMESGQASLELAALDVTALARRAVAAFAPLAEADGVTLTLEAEPTPPVQADGARIHQVLANLLANALRYAPQGEQSAPTVRVLVQQAGGAVRVSVSDNGPGLTAAQQAQVFERFWRGDAARSRGQGGSGLGLAIARGIVQAHGGALSVSSPPGQGATFTFTLPT
jgi:signal transduction histidine kinase